MKKLMNTVFQVLGDAMNRIAELLNWLLGGIASHLRSSPAQPRAEDRAKAQEAATEHRAEATADKAMRVVSESTLVWKAARNLQSGGDATPYLAKLRPELQGWVRLVHEAGNIDLLAKAGSAGIAAHIRGSCLLDGLESPQDALMRSVGKTIQAPASVPSPAETAMAARLREIRARHAANDAAPVRAYG